MDIVSTSAGRSSMYLALLMKKRNPDAKFVFMDTGAEHPKTYEFLKRCNDFFDLNITCIKAVIHQTMGDGVGHQVVPVDSLKHDNGVMTEYMSKNGTPVAVGATCSDRMKTLAYRFWLGSLVEVERHIHLSDEKNVQEVLDSIDGFHDLTLKKKNRAINEFFYSKITTWLGMRVDEPVRLRYPKGIKYLADISDFTKEDVLEFWSRQPFDLDIPEHLGNCIFCVKKSPVKIALAARHEPKLASEWEGLIYSPKVRVMEGRKDAQDVMYRDYMSFRSIVRSFEGFSTKELERRLSLYRDDSVCASSCEGDYSQNFIQKEIQLDLLKDYSIKGVISDS